jgi:hypothetical protein
VRDKTTCLLHDWWHWLLPRDYTKKTLSFHHYAWWKCFFFTWLSISTMYQSHLQAIESNWPEYKEKHAHVSVCAQAHVRTTTQRCLQSPVPILNIHCT